jgi:hypothetical protein
VEKENAEPSALNTPCFSLNFGLGNVLSSVFRPSTVGHPLPHHFTLFDFIVNTFLQQTQLLLGTIPAIPVHRLLDGKDVFQGDVVVERVLRSDDVPSTPALSRISTTLFHW